MTERMVTEEGTEVVESVRNKAKQENITIPQAAQKLNIPVHRYYKFLGEMNKGRGGKAAKTRHPKPRAAKVSQEPDASGRSVNVRELRDQIARLTEENGKLREELLDVLLENRHLRAEVERP